jgi:uncharacterized protein (UPF0212 family)
MTANEKDRIECAIRHIQTAVDVDPWAVEIAVEAMEKMIPMENLPYEMGVDGGVIYPCGNCGEDVEGYDFCPWCGQKVWRKI